MLNRTGTRFQRLWVLNFAVSLIVMGSFALVSAQDDTDRRVQIVQNEINTLEFDKYLLRDLQEGDELSVYVTALSGNLDPTLNLAEGDVDVSAALEEISTAIEEQVQQGADPFQALADYEFDIVLIRDDDSGDGYDATFTYTIPADGDYSLVVGSTPRNETFGDYRLTMGINAPDVQTGRASATDGIVIGELVEGARNDAVQVVRGELSSARPRVIRLNDIAAGETLMIYAEAVDSELRPEIVLEDFGGKGIRSDNLNGTANTATLEYTIPETAIGHQIVLTGANETTGAYRVLIGINAPDVLMGDATVNSFDIIDEPIPVSVGLRIEQITGIDQRAENFEIAGRLRLAWQDAQRAFRPDRCECQAQSFIGPTFSQFLADETILWPDYIFLNQQGRRDTQLRGATVLPNGATTYGEQFTVTLQAPDFHFRAYPFDKQTFFVRVEAIYPEDVFVFQPDPEFTRFGDQLGEEEWYIVNTDTFVESNRDTSQFIIRFDMRRHLNFYLYRILLPIGLILIVSWFTFFLENYDKRIDVSSANLLIFVAFNFTVSGDLPRLGYLTFLDTILIGTFAVTSLILAANVYLKRLERIGKHERARRIDKALIWLYPVSYIVIYTILAVYFLVF